MAFESLQKKLSRFRPPQVHITYDVEVAGAIEKRELPFVIGVLADFSGKPAEPLPRVRDRRFVAINRDSFDSVLERCRPRIELQVPSRLQDDGETSPLAVTLNFGSLADFSPEPIAAQMPTLSDLLALRHRLTTVSSALFGNDRLEEKLQSILAEQEELARTHRELQAMKDPLNVVQPSSAVQELLDYARIEKSAEARAAAAEWLSDFLEQAARGELVVSRDTESIINARLATLDHVITRQLDEVLHHPDFQRLEATWRSLWYLVDQTEISISLQIRVLNISKRDLLREFERATEFDQTSIYKKVYEDEYGTVGGTPFALLIGDYSFSRDGRDIALLTQMTQLGAAAHVPFIAGASPGMFNLDGFTELTLPRDLSKIFDSDDYAAWRSFRQGQDARFAALVLPHMLLRLPYASDTNPVERFRYEERVDAHEHYLWGNSAFALAARIADSFARSGWYAQIRGVEGGGLITGLPTHTTVNDDGEVVLKCPTEIAITDRRQLELVRLGFVPLLHVKNSDSAVFFAVPSCCKPQKYLDDELNAAELASVGLDCVLAVSRFTHYLRCLMRDKIGTFASAQECEEYLNLWLATYVLSNEGGVSPDASVPLKYGKVELSESFGTRETHRTNLEIQPLFQFANVNRPLRATVLLPQSAYR